MVSLSFHVGVSHDVRQQRTLAVVLHKYRSQAYNERRLSAIYSSSIYVPRLGVPATSRILTGDSQKFSFSILRKVPFLIF